MTDIKKFTGFLSSDGKTHTSQKSAVAHELELKTTAAVRAAFPEGYIAGVPNVDGQSIADFVLDNRAQISAALNQEVLLRKKRTPKKAANDPSAGQAAA